MHVVERMVSPIWEKWAWLVALTQIIGLNQSFIITHVRLFVRLFY